jgi:mannitol-1-phosphate/altronate dehydrogenase
MQVETLYNELCALFCDETTKAIVLDMTSADRSYVDENGQFTEQTKHDLAAGPTSETLQSTPAILLQMFFERFKREMPGLTVLFEAPAPYTNEAMADASRELLREWFSKSLIEQDFLRYIVKPTSVRYRPTNEEEKALLNGLSQGKTVEFNDVTLTFYHS